MLLARMSSAACLSLQVGRLLRTIIGIRLQARRSDCSFVLAVPVQTSVGKLYSSSWCGKVGARSASTPQASLPRCYAATGLKLLPLESTAQAIRAGLLAMATTTTFFGALESRASSHAPICARSRFMRIAAARAPCGSNPHPWQRCSSLHVDDPPLKPLLTSSAQTEGYSGGSSH